MVYATDESQALRVKTSSTSASFFNAANVLQFDGRTRGIETGYTVGGGVEQAFIDEQERQGRIPLLRSRLEVANVAAAAAAVSAARRRASNTTGTSYAPA